MKTYRRIDILVVGWVMGLLGTLSLPEAGRAADVPTAQVVVYLEVADPSGADVTISTGAALLNGEAVSATLRPSLTTLHASELLGRQVNWVEQAVPAGHYDHLSLTIEAVEGTIGRASVQPEVPDEPLRIPLDLFLEPETAALVILRWTARPVDHDTPTYTPLFNLVEPRVPPLGSIAFVSNEGSGYLSVIDRFSGRIVEVLAAGVSPRGMAYSELAQWLYVADAGASEIVAIDVLSMRLVKKSPLPSGSEPSRVAVDDFQNVLYVLNYGTEILSVLDPRSLEEIDRLLIGRGPRGMALDPRNGRVYVSLELDGLVQVYDPGRRELIAPLRLSTAPGELAFSPDTEMLYVADESQRRVTAYHTLTGAATRGLTLCSVARGLVFNPLSQRLYVAQVGCRAIAILQPEGELDVGSIQLPERPGLIALDRNYRHLLVTLPRTNELVVYNANSRNLEGTIQVGQRPYAVLVP